MYLWKQGKGSLAAAVLNALTRAAISSSCCRSRMYSCSRHVMPAELSVPPSAKTSAMSLALGCEQAICYLVYLDCLDYQSHAGSDA
jgi:hypothetical protein